MKINSISYTVDTVYINFLFRILQSTSNRYCILNIMQYLFLLETIFDLLALLGPIRWKSEFGENNIRIWILEALPNFQALAIIKFFQSIFLFSRLVKI